MLRQLARLTRPVPAAGPRAVAIAVYADARGRLIPAAETGREGVACLDDAARALGLFCDLWASTASPLMRAWAEALLDLVLYLQEPDGRFLNFIADWSGRRNRQGATSAAGGGFWQARGLLGLAKASVVLDDGRAREALARALPHVRRSPAPSDVRAIQALAALVLFRADGSRELRADLAAWCDEIAACRRGGILMNNPDEATPHLWGHVQEGVLAEAGALLARDDHIALARESAHLFLAPLIESSLPRDGAQPYGVACGLYGVERLAAVTGAQEFHELATKARAWFDGRNSAGLPVYDRRAGLVHDGIDDGVLNAHSGAESNIVAAEALFAEVRGGLSAGSPGILASFADDVRVRLTAGT